MSSVIVSEIDHFWFGIMHHLMNSPLRITAPGLTLETASEPLHLFRCWRHPPRISSPPLRMLELTSMVTSPSPVSTTSRPLSSAVRRPPSHSPTLPLLAPIPVLETPTLTLRVSRVARPNTLPGLESTPLLEKAPPRATSSRSAAANPRTPPTPTSVHVSFQLWDYYPGSYW